MRPDRRAARWALLIGVSLVTACATGGAGNRGRVLDSVPRPSDTDVRRDARLLAMLDAWLGTRAHVAGAYTMGDIPLVCSAHRWYGLPLERRRHANVEAWLARVRARPAFAGVLPDPIT